MTTVRNCSLLIAFSCLSFFACDSDDTIAIDPVITPEIETPAQYTFERNGASTVSFSGQTTRIKMASELIDLMKDFDAMNKGNLLEFFRNDQQAPEDMYPYSDESLNTSTKSVKSKVAASQDFFSANSVESAEIKDQFEAWIVAQVDEVKPQEDIAAIAGTAGQIADGTSTRYVTGKGLEPNQLVNKGLIGALMVDQMLNNYLSTAVLDDAASGDGTNREKNDAGTVEEGKNYTAMEHKWDEAYGYLYGTSEDLSKPNATIGKDDDFLNKYMGRVEGDADFTGIAERVFNAFKLGRAAIVAKDYAVRDEQATIIRKAVSEIIAIRAVYYLQQAKASLTMETPDYGAAFHGLSEGYGFIYSLRFTRKSDSNAPYFVASEVDDLLKQLMEDGDNGLWDVKEATLDVISNAIADKFDFTVAQAGSTN